jgi:hypothetical protein
MIAAGDNARTMKLATALLILLLTVSALAEDDVLQLYDIRDIAKSENRPAKEIATQLEGHLKGITSVTVKEGVLAVKAPAVVHETVRNYLDALRRGKDDILRVFPIADLVTGGQCQQAQALRRNPRDRGPGR